MSIEKVNFNKKTNVNRRFADIALLDEVVFHTKDLANLWNIKNKNTLYQTLSRYEKNGLLYRIYNGLYSISEMKDIDPYLLGIKILHGSAYISTETILYDAGIINQKPREITLAGPISKRFSVGGYRYRSRKLQDKFLFNNAGIKIKDGSLTASTERAVLDMLYFSPRKYLDAYNSNLIDWDKVREISLEIGYNIKIPRISK